MAPVSDQPFCAWQAVQQSNRTALAADLARWRVTDDWPDPVPVTEAEVALFERWFADLIEEIASRGE